MPRPGTTSPLIVGSLGVAENRLPSLSMTQKYDVSNGLAGLCCGPDDGSEAGISNDRRGRDRVSLDGRGHPGSDRAGSGYRRDRAMCRAAPPSCAGSQAVGSANCVNGLRAVMAGEVHVAQDLCGADDHRFRSHRVRSRQSVHGSVFRFPPGKTRVVASNCSSCTMAAAISPS